MDVGRGPAVLSFLDVWVLQNIVFIVDNGPFAANEDNGLAVVQHPNLVRGEQLAPCLLEVLRIGTVAAPAAAGGRGINGFFPQQLGNVLVGFLFIAA